MGVPAYNLVVVKGDKQDLAIFEKVAYKNDSEAICFGQLLPLPAYLAQNDPMSDEVEAYRHLIYGSRWVAAFGILIEKSDTYLKYFFNSKWTKAQLDYVAIKFNQLRFTHVFREIADDWRFGVIEYENGERIDEIIVHDDKMDWQIASDIHSYLSMEELWHKFQLLKQDKPDIVESMKYSYRTEEYSFFTFFDQNEYLKNSESFYDSLYIIERELETRNLYYARNGTGYPFITNSPIFQLEFIVQNFLPSKTKSERILSALNYAINSNTVSDSERINAFIFVHQKMDMKDRLYPAVKDFILDRIEKMKSYLDQVESSSQKSEVDRQWVPVLMDLVFGWLDKEDFQGWVGLEKEQTSFFHWFTQVEAILEDPDREADSDNGLPF